MKSNYSTYSGIKFLLVFLFLLALVFYTGRLLENQNTGRLYLAATLSADSQAFYTKLELPLSLTYISKHLKRVKTPVQNLLVRIMALAPDRIDYRLVAPDSESGRTYAIKKKSPPFMYAIFNATNTANKRSGLRLSSLMAITPKF